MKTTHHNDAFICAACGSSVAPASGTCRDHCTACLCSQHVDNSLPGDRASSCGGLLRPLYAQIHQKKGIMIFFRCDMCGITRNNKAAEDDNQEVLAQLLLKANQRAEGLNA